MESGSDDDLGGMNLFWGLNIKGGNKYSQKVTQPFQVSSAAIAPEANEGNHYVYAAVGADEYLLCTLNKDKWPQHTLNLQLGVGEDISFIIKPKEATGPVTLSGQFLGTMGGLSDDEFDDEGDSDDNDMHSLLGGDSDEDDVDDEEEDHKGEEGISKVMELDSGDEGEEEEEEKSKPAQSKKRPAVGLEQPSAKKAKAAEVKPQQQTPKSEQAKQQQTPKSEPAKQQPPKKESTKGKQQTLPGGTVIEDVVVGNGPKVKKGQMVSVRYVGQLASNNKVFDTNQNGKPFKFKLGMGQVIKGWDVGVEGMCIGGKRILRVPAAQGYGKRGAPPKIPPNATLVFEVQLLGAK